MAAVKLMGLGDKYQMMHLRFAVSVVRTLVDETNARRRSCCVVFQFHVGFSATSIQMNSRSLLPGRLECFMSCFRYLV